MAFSKTLETSPLLFVVGLATLACAGATGPTAQPATTPASPAGAAAQAQNQAQPADPPAAPAQAAAGEAAADDSAIVIGRRKTIRSSVLGEERTYLVYTPQGYQHSTGAYPVLYLLDGDAHFHHTTGLLQFLAQQQRMPEMLVVAIGNTDRTRDMTPTRVEKFPTSGGAGKFLAFITDELAPEIERSYRTAPYRVLVGHSFGGLFATYALIRAPEAFQAYVSISPSLWWQDQLMQRDAEALFGRRPELDAFFYYTLGNEEKQMRDSNESFAAMLKTRAPAGLQWKFTLLENEDHGSVPHRSTYLALEALFADWRLPQTAASLEDVKQHYAGLSHKFRYPFAIPENTLNLFGYKLLFAGQSHEAIEAFRHNISLYPESANVYDSLGEAYEKSGQRELARENYAIAVGKATAAEHPFLAVYRQNLERASKPQP